MEGLTPEQLEHFKGKLLERKHSIESQLETFAKKNADINNDYETVFEQIGDTQEENADEVTAYEDNLAIEHELEESLMDIDAALERIEKGTYGFCEGCKQMISLERLEIMPEATECIKCER
jgi:RNA polymerase-binding transcription factor DksA